MLPKENYNVAVVIGASLSGLITAKILSKYFKKIIILERDSLNSENIARKGQPHAVQGHYLQLSGLNILCNYYPDLKESLEERGAVKLDLSNDLSWYSYGGVKKKFVSGLNIYCMSRFLLEQIISEKTLPTSNIHLKEKVAVKKLLFSDDLSEVCGVQVKELESGEFDEINADLVIDTSGRGSITSKWISANGYEPPKESKVLMNATYHTRIYENNLSRNFKKERIVFTPAAPLQKCSVLLFPMEGEKQVLYIAGMHNASPPTEAPELLDFLKEIPHQDIYERIVDAKPVTKFFRYKFKESIWRHYEKLKRFPSGLLVLGDAFQCFNPVYAQGITSVAFQVQVLDDLLKRNTSIKNISKPFFKKAAKASKVCWRSSTNEDFRFPETKGEKSLLTNAINSYVKQIHKASIKDGVVFKEFIYVAGMLKSPAALFHPSILLRIMKSRFF